MNFFSQKMVLIEIQYKGYDSKLLAIIEVFKTGHHYLKNCKYNVFNLMAYNNLYYFIDTKNLSSRYVY